MAAKKQPTAMPGRSAKAAGSSKARKQPAKKGAARTRAKADNGREFVKKVERTVRELSRLLAEPLRDAPEVNGRKYDAFTVKRQVIKRELRKVAADRAQMYFIGGGRVDWRSRYEFRIKFKESPLCGGTQTRFDSSRPTGKRFHECSVEVGGFPVRKELDYDIVFGGSMTPEDPSIIIDPGPVLLKPRQ